MPTKLTWTQPKSRASKPVSKKWDKKNRFSKGHDFFSSSVVPEEFLLGSGNVKFRRPKPRVGVYRAASFGMTREERLIEKALFAYNSGKFTSLQEALEATIIANPEPEQNIIEVIARKMPKK